ncbi:hypothetical protein C5167_000958 [Papaver somniferum]|uniref:Uncharacterized protein n=1 Tax=Papaver somniferum TaxID=3469 RepID=A0A4Y7KU03_PAPSO|nr:hypothetical protein C5167_000958 [Papaver somniferum]
MENQSTIMYANGSVSSSTSSNTTNKVIRPSYPSTDSLLVVSDNINSNKHGRSKAQMCLKKIIDLISSGSSANGKMKEKKGLGIDLNLRLGCFGTDDDDDDENGNKGFRSNCSGVIGGDCINNVESNVEFTSGSILVKNGENECDFKGVDVIEVEEKERRELSEVTDLETPEIEDVGMKKNGEKGYMDLLVEAARLISGDFKDETDAEVKTKNRGDKIEVKRRKSKRINNECRLFDIYEDFEDISPVVRSKRGRNQVLPHKYRDSVLDPWKSTKQQGFRSGTAIEDIVADDFHVLSDNNNKHGRSKAQICLQKILDIISSGSSQKEKKFEKKKGLGIDLNLTLGCFGTNDDKEFSSDCSGVIGGGDCINNGGGSNVEFISGSILVKNGDGECDLKGVDVIEVEEEEEEKGELSEVTDLEAPEIEEKGEEEEKGELSEVIDLKTPEIEEKGDVEMEELVVEKSEMKKMGEEGYLDLLVEAARLISGDFKEDETDEGKTKEDRDEKIGTKRRKSNRNRMFDVYEDFEDISPIVKSKRGRNQVLPLKYRDSVLDPWKSTKQQSRSIRRVSNRNRH